MGHMTLLSAFPPVGFGIRSDDITLPKLPTIGCLPATIFSSGSATNLGLQYPDAAAV